MEQERLKIDEDCQGNEMTPYIEVNISKGYISDVLKEYNSDDYVFMLIGGKTASKVFSEKSPKEKQIIGISLNTAAGIKISKSKNNLENSLEVNQIHVNTKTREISAGAAVTLEQISKAAQEILGMNFRVLGADLTSRESASAGGTIMTNGAGLKRINFGDAALSIRFHDGKNSRKITDKEKMQSVVGTYGYTGIVEEVKVQAIEAPKYDFRFAVPVNNNAKDLADIIDFFGDKTDIKIENGKIITDDYVVDGIELVTKDSIINQHSNDPKIQREIEQVQSLLKNSAKDALVFITGYSHEEFLENENNWDENYEVFMKKFSTEEIHPFDSVDAMRKIREEGPDQAKSQKLKTKIQYSESTDINVVINRANLRENSELVLACYDDHKKKILDLLEEENPNGLVGNLNIYGHLNPQGLDLHYRVTIGANDKKAMEEAKDELKKYYAELVQKIAGICEETNSKFTGGEKGAKEDSRIYEALVNLNIPATNDMKKKQETRIKTIKNSSPKFNWRAVKMLQKQKPAKLATTT